MSEPSSSAVLFRLKHFSCLVFALVAIIFSGCSTVDDGGSGGYYSGPTLTPVQEAAMMQDRLGQITRAQIR